jgi:acylphosphatase
MPKILFFILAYFVSLISAQPEGWRMVDRFYGFRYEITGPNILSVGFEAAAEKEADRLGCFGWIQKTKAGSLVGEARCNKVQGPKYQEWLEKGSHGASISSFETKVYHDTKIRLHFSKFRILEESRDTCFLDLPHQCPEFDATATSKSKSHPEL